MMKKLYVIAHTHWDREWHKTFQENRVRLVRFFDDLMDTLEQDPAYSCFVLDGQTSLVLDYLEIKPSGEARLRTLIADGRIVIGPWYVQPDENLPCAESIIRNLLLAKGISDSFGGAMNVGYLPDSFGQSGAMPTFLKGFGIDYALFYRGLADEDSPCNDFHWAAPDGSEVLTSWMPTGYGNAMFLTADLQKNIGEIDDICERLNPRSLSGDLLLMCGSDQCFVKKFLPAACEKLNAYYRAKGTEMQLRLTSPDAYFKKLERCSETLPRVVGELRKGQYSRTHISIGATRMDIKLKNFKIENLYKQILEPLSVLLSRCGMQSDQSLIQRGWRYIVENHAHDSICCVCTDIVHTEMLGRLAAAEQIGNTLVREKLQELYGLIRYQKERGRPVVLFSSALGARRSIVRAEVFVKHAAFCLTNESGAEVACTVLAEERINLKDLRVGLVALADDWYKKITIEFYAEMDGVGYRTFYINENTAPREETRGMLAENTMENDLVCVQICADGTLTITDKATGKVFPRQHIFIDGGNSGDEYDYSPPLNDCLVSSEGMLESVIVKVNTALKASVVLNYNIQNVPETTFAEERSTEKTALRIETTVTLYKNDPQVYFSSTIRNHIKNHRVQVSFCFTQKVKTHFASLQLGQVERKNQFDETKESVKTWSERYYAVFNQHKFCGVRGADGNGFILMNQGLPQYEVENSEVTKLNITLLSCVGHMGNENLLYRKGRRSGALCPTPNAQMQGNITLEYAFLPIQAKTDCAGVSEQYQNPIRALCCAEYEQDGILPDKLCLLRGDGNLVLSALKPAQQGGGSIARFVNQKQTECESAKLWVNPWLFRQATPVNLAECPFVENVLITRRNNPDGSDKAAFAGEIQFMNFPPNGMKTLRLDE